jgi:hypothetical protein
VKLTTIVALSLVLGAFGCGGAAAPSAPPPATPASAPVEPADQSPNASGAATSMPAAGAAAPPAAAPAPQYAQPSAAREEAAPATTAQGPASDLSRAEAEVAAGDCTTACRALGSMERAVTFLCRTGEADRCANAKARLGASRRRVRDSCGSCPGGPSVDPDAPVPSR